MPLDAQSVFYVYLFLNPDGTPCYVGKGKGRRYRDMRRGYNPMLTALIERAGGELPFSIVQDRMTEEAAFALEIALIKKYGRRGYGGILANLTDGGDGTAGSKWTPERTEFMRAVKTGTKHTEETRAKMRASYNRELPNSFAGRKHTEESRAKMSASLKGHPSYETQKEGARSHMLKRIAELGHHPTKGIKHTEEACRNMRAAAAHLKGKPNLARHGVPISEAHKQAIRLYGTGKKHSEETRKKMSAAAVLRECAKKERLGIAC